LRYDDDRARAHTHVTTTYDHDGSRGTLIASRAARHRRPPSNAKPPPPPRRGSPQLCGRVAAALAHAGHDEPLSPSSPPATPPIAFERSASVVSLSSSRGGRANSGASDGGGDDGGHVIARCFSSSHARLSSCADATIIVVGSRCETRNCA